MVVSPALRSLLESDEGALLRPRLPYRIAGDIGDAGLSAPREYAYVAGSDRIAESGWDVRLDRFGSATPDERLDAVLSLLAVVMVTVLLLPIGVFVAVAVRFGGERRDRRLAALRLVGADWISGAGAAVVLLVTALSLPVLWRMMRPDGLRTE